MPIVKTEDLRQDHFTPKWYLNGFPKSGLHLLSLMMVPLAKPMYSSSELWGKPWAGPFMFNSWANYEKPIARVTYQIGRVKDGLHLMGHCSYSEEMERFLWHLGVATIFIYRDPRDVAVSQAYHILDEKDDVLLHPNKAHYRAMASFEDVLMATIVGTTDENGVEYPGVIDRWEKYAGWRDINWVLKIRFEDLINERFKWAKIIVQYGLDRVSNLFGVEPIIVQENADKLAEIMVEWGKQTDKSCTFRKGVRGDWREHFTPEIKEAFKERCGDWLIEMSYEKDHDW